MFIKHYSVKSKYFRSYTTNRGYSKKIRTRIAPSPTGEPHIGTAYIALMNYLFARKSGGEFILRMDDTDLKRCTNASEKNIIKSLNWLGIQWKEGPDIGGPYGPYRQSERTSLYQLYAQKLLDNNQAFKCYCQSTGNKISTHNHERQGYNGNCLRLTIDEIRKLTAKNTPFVIRLKVPSEGYCTVPDFIRGAVKIPWQQVDMQVLIKSDGMPTYHLASVIDDHEMKITHVIRGYEWLLSAPKHLLLFSYFGWEPPKITHLPLLLNEDRTKLSKRKNNVSILWYEKMGFLPEAIINFLGLAAVKVLPEQDEKLSFVELENKFALENIQASGAIFDKEKLEWLNARWLRENYKPKEFVALYKNWLFKDNILDKSIELSQERVKKLSDVGNLILPFITYLRHLVLSDYEEIESELNSHQKIEMFKKGLLLIIQELTSLIDWNQKEINQIFKKVSKELNLKLKDFVKPFYLSILGEQYALPLFASMEILGKEICLDRLKIATTLLNVAILKEQPAQKYLKSN